MTSRLVSVNDVVRNWTFLASGLTQVAHHLKYNLSLDVYRKTLFRLVKQPRTAWVGIAYDDTIPVAFLVAHESTPFFSTVREFDASIYYHESGYASGVNLLQSSFDTFCRTNNIRRYFVTTCRKSGRPMHVFGVEWTGLQHAYRVFKKELT